MMIYSRLNRRRPKGKFGRDWEYLETFHPHYSLVYCGDALRNIPTNRCVVPLSGGRILRLAQDKFEPAAYGFEVQESENSKRL